MLFNSYVFIFLFLPITLVVFFTLSKFHLAKSALAWLTITSLFFYGFWNPPFLILMLVSIVFNHRIGRLIEEAELNSKKAFYLMWAGLIGNLALIGYYKYTDFILSTINSLAGTDIPLTKIFLPLGISFYTFTQMGYLVDAYRGETKGNNYDLLTYTLFISFFPQLIAGPILRHDELIPQFRNLRKIVFSQKNLALGLTMFCIGLGKKVLIADNISPWVAPVFAHASEVSFLESWVGAISYTLQLYFDFSGYSDMAIGLGLMFNIKLPINFNSPYKATSISDFWRRWHITLSNLLRDYLYIPLGGNRKGQIRQYINLLATMLLGGLWHGAGWTFVIWGGLHGSYLCINHRWRKLNISMPKFLGWMLTFLSVVVSWVLFRAITFGDAAAILKAMLGMNGVIVPGSPLGRLSALTALGIEIKPWKDLAYIPEVFGNKLFCFIVLIALLLCVAFLPNSQEILEKHKPNWKWAIGVGIVGSLCLLSLNRVSEFLYFQF
jgi:alginate O-acetyltransferase complex protein AlgI